MSAGAKILLILGVIFLLLILVCCGGLLTLGFMGQRYMARSISDDPQVVRQVTAGIVQIDVPEGLEPMFSMDMKIPFTDEPAMTWVMYRHPPTNSTLLLSSFGEVMADANRGQLHAQMQESLREQGLGQEETTGPREIEQRQITVRGKPETFTFVKAKAPETGGPRLEISGAFQGRQGNLVLFFFNGDSETYPEAEIVKAIESIQ
jgi:uncharacterized protein YneF (UPF0154 family)